MNVRSDTAIFYNEKYKYDFILWNIYIWALKDFNQSFKNGFTLPYKNIVPQDAMM